MPKGEFRSDVNKAKFRWAVGVESSCIPHLSINQFEWTQHEQFWREDFYRVAHELGCQWMRYSLPWHIVEPSPGVYDWRWADERIHLAGKLGINLMLDLVHFGTPTWLPDAFGDLDFPHALESFSRAFARQYAGAIPSVSPINEPLITALFCGDVGLWPPHGRSLRVYMTILSRVAQALNRSIRALRETMPGTEIIVCDALEFPTVEPKAVQVASPQLMKTIEDDLTLRLQRRHIVLDLVTGRVDQEHPLFCWLESNGFSRIDMNWFLRHPAQIDVLGLDYYCHSEMELYPCSENHFRQRVPSQLAGLHRVTRDYWHRYHLPLMITETSCQGDDLEKRNWLESTVGDIRRLREEGIPVIGYTWWPLLDHLDWDGALLHQIGKIHHVGIYRLEREAGGELGRKPTVLTEDYRAIIAQGDKAAGALKQVTAKPGAAQEIAPEPFNQGRVQLDFPIIVHSHLRWDGVWQRPQQFISRLSQTHRALFVEGPILVKHSCIPYARLRQLAQFPHVTLMQTFFPIARFSDGKWVDRERLRLLREALDGPLKGQFERPVHWFYDPMAAPFCINGLEAAAIVYDCMDELSQFKFAPPEIAVRERFLLNAADVVFVGGRKLHQSKSRFHSNTHFYGCGVEVDHFRRARAAETVVPYDLDFIHRPILGYFGVIDERLDYELIDKLAQEDPQWSIVMIGPVAKVDPNALPSRVNIYWLGQRDYAQLPAYCKAFSACLMPFALNEATEFINPTKALEYMASGKAVISSAVPDVVSNFGEIIKIARSREEFIQLCRLAVESPGHFNIERGLSLAEQNGWEAIVARLENHIRDVFRQRLVGQRHVKNREMEIGSKTL